MGDIGVKALRAKRECEAAEAPERCKRGLPHTSRSGRRFRVAVVADPVRNGRPIDGTQLLLELCDQSGRVARRRDRAREVVLAELERRGESALEDHAEPVSKRALTEEFCYLSIGGEYLVTTLRGLSPSEADYVRRYSLSPQTAARSRRVVWPSQSTAPIVRVDHADDPAPPCDLPHP